MLTLATFAVNGWAPGGSGCLGPRVFPGRALWFTLQSRRDGSACTLSRPDARQRVSGRCSRWGLFLRLPAFRYRFPFQDVAGVTACAGLADSRPGLGFQPWGLGFRCGFGFMVIMYNILEKCIKIRFAVRAPVYSNSHSAGRFAGP